MDRVINSIHDAAVYRQRTTTVKPRRVSCSGREGASRINGPCHGFAGGVNRHGGDVLQNPKVVALLWGHYFAANPGVQAAFDQFFTDIFASDYLEPLRQYGVSAPTYAGSSVVYGGLHQSEGGLVSQIQEWLDKKALPIPASAAEADQWLYVVIPPPGELLAASDAPSNADVGGYHNHHSFHFTGSGFGDLLGGGAKFWTGDFSASGSDEMLFYNPGDHNWWFGRFTGEELSWTPAGNTSSFGSLSKDLFLRGDFQGNGTAGLLLYRPEDGNWWLGVYANEQVAWQLAGNTGKPGTGFGNLASGGCQFWVADFSGSGSDEVLFHNPADSNWWLGTFHKGQLSWALAGNTTGFGNLTKHPFFLGNFQGNGRPCLLVYNPADGTWWLGAFSGKQMSWGLAGNTGRPGTGFGNLVSAGCIFWVGNFAGAGNDDVLFYHPSDGNWWISSFHSGQMSWNLAGNTASYGNLSKVPFFLGNFEGTGRPTILFYNPGDDTWWLSTFYGSQMSWTQVGNTARFGDLSKGAFFVGNFQTGGRSGLVFYNPADGTWRRGTFRDSLLSWIPAGQTGVTVNFTADVPYAVAAFAAPLRGAAASDIVNNIACCLSHELVEAFVNPRDNGYYADPNGCEIADIGEADPATGEIVTVNVGAWSVERYWSNQDNACVPG